MTLQLFQKKQAFDPQQKTENPYLEYIIPKNWLFFNGLGSRGALQGPYLSAQFCGFLTTQKKKLLNSLIINILGIFKMLTTAVSSLCY